MAAITFCSDFRAQKIKSDSVSTESSLIWIVRSVYRKKPIWEFNVILYKTPWFQDSGEREPCTEDQGA